MSVNVKRRLNNRLMLHKMLHKKTLDKTKEAALTATPASEPGSIPDEVHPINSFKQLLRVQRHMQRFFTRTSPKNTTIQIRGFSLHGYSSLRMLQDGPISCKEKVSVVAT